jgi:hypothetical protein
MMGQEEPVSKRARRVESEKQSMPEPPLSMGKTHPPPFTLLLQSREEMRDSFLAYVKDTFAPNTVSSYEKIFARCEAECWEACQSNDIDVIPYPERKQSVIKNHFENFLKTKAVKESLKYPRLAPVPDAVPPILRGLTTYMVRTTASELSLPFGASLVQLISVQDEEFYVTGTWHDQDWTVQLNIPKRLLKYSAVNDATTVSCRLLDGQAFMSSVKHFCSCLKDGWCEHGFAVLTTLADPESQYKSTQEKEHWTSKNADLTWEHGETSDSRDSLEKAFPGEFERMLRMLSSTDPMRIVRELKKGIHTVSGLGVLIDIFPPGDYPAKTVERCQRCHKDFNRHDESDFCTMSHPTDSMERLGERDGQSRYYCVKCQKTWAEPLGASAMAGRSCYEGPHETDMIVVRKEGWFHP